MKKTKMLLLCTMLTISAVSCTKIKKVTSIASSSSVGVSEVTSNNVSSTSEKGSSSSSSETATLSSESKSETASDTSSESYYSENTISSLTSSSAYSGTSSPNKLSFTGSEIQNGSYTQNYSVDGKCVYTVNGVSFNFYRYGVSGSSVVLYADNSYYHNRSFGGKEGSLFNVTPITGIDNVSITYTYLSGNDGTTNPNVTFGEDNVLDDYKVSLPSVSDSSLKQTYTIDVSGYNFEYLSINSGSYNVYISEVVISYRNLDGISATYHANSGSDKARVNPVKYTGTLASGKAKVNVPVATTYNKDTNTYDVTETKTLTYYTLSYVNSHPEVKEDATVTDPVLVCAYYTSFGTWPANYSMNANEVNSTFGTNARKVSKYTRTDGYAKSVPYNNYGSTDAPLYYELDVGLNSNYSTSSRDVGRIVVWEAGFNGEGYDSSPVCVFTDDHYATFQEYYNNGEFSTRFNATSYATASTYSNPVTYTLGDITQNFYTGPADEETTTPSDGDDSGGGATAIEIPDDERYYQVTSISQIDGTGDYLFVDTNYCKMSTEYMIKYFAATDATIGQNEDNLCYISCDTSSCVPLHITSENGGYYISYESSSEGTCYIGATAEKNIVSYTDKNNTGTKWSISISSCIATISTGSVYIHYNTSTPRFTTYKSGSQDEISLFKKAASA